MGESGAGDRWFQWSIPNLLLFTCRRDPEPGTVEGTAPVRTHVRLWPQQLSIQRSLGCRVQSVETPYIRGWLNIGVLSNEAEYLIMWFGKERDKECPTKPVSPWSGCVNVPGHTTSVIMGLLPFPPHHVFEFHLVSGVHQ